MEEMRERSGSHEQQNPRALVPIVDDCRGNKSERNVVVCCVLSLNDKGPRPNVGK